MRKTSRLAAVILILAFALRLAYCWNLPLSGDESVSLLQAAGKAVGAGRHIPLQPAPAAGVQQLMEYSPSHGPADVLESMKKEGMHPPLYYLLLHGFMRMIGNDVFWLRLISVLFASGAVYLVFLLVRDLRCDREALWAAFLTAVNFHSIRLAGMVRPYPLLLLLAVLSTWLLFRLHSNLERRFRNPWLWGYAAAALAGLYTLNHFAYLMLAQMLWLILLNRRRVRLLAAPALAAAAVGLGYLPWLSSLLYQVRVVNRGSFYFHGQAMPVKFLVIAYEQLFTHTWTPRFGPFWFLIGLAAFACGAYGVYRFWSDTRGRSFLLLMALYAALHLLADRMMNMQTFTSWKFLFFMVPMLLVILAGGLEAFIHRNFLFKALALVTAGALLWNAALGFSRPEKYDGPRSLERLHRVARRQPAPADTLVVVSHPNGRFVLSAAAVLPPGVDLMAYLPDRTRSVDESRYDQVIWVDFGVLPDSGPAALDRLMGPANDYLLLEDQGLTGEAIQIWQRSKEADEVPSDR